MSQSFNDRVAEVIAEEQAEPLRWWYLSFAGETFNGACIVKAQGIATAVIVCSLLDINPGGEVLGVPMPEESVPPEQYRDRLLSKSDIQEFWPDSKTIREFEAAQEETPDGH